MEWVRVTRDVYGQTVVQGASWDLLPWFAGLAAAVVVAHAAYMAVRGLARKGRA